VNSLVPVLEVGGTHVSAALVDPADWSVQQTTRYSVDADASADAIIDRFWRAGNSLRAPAGVTWGVAMPDPFDYRHGIGEFAGVGKFAALRGVAVGAELRSRLRGDVVFLNDADGFVLGEWVAGAAAGARRCAGLTLGTGIGSGWLVDGVVTDPGMPPGGRLHRMTVDGAPLEDIVSRRAIRRAYAAAGGEPEADVLDIANAARSGSDVARQVLDAAMSALGSVVARRVAGFGAEVLVIGGSMAGSWELFDPAFRAGAADVGLPELRLAASSEHAPLIGAALHATRQTVSE
jgi:glucokinase